MLTLMSIQNSPAHQVWPRIPYTHLRIRSLRDQASRFDPIRSSESGNAIPDPDPDHMIGSFDPNHDSTASVEASRLDGCPHIPFILPELVTMVLECRTEILITNTAVQAVSHHFDSNLRMLWIQKPADLVARFGIQFFGVLLD